MGVLREHRGVGVAEAMPGAKLTELVGKYLRKLFTVHRKLLKGDQEYQWRTRDPLHELLMRNHNWSEDYGIQQVRMWVAYPVYGYACITGASLQWRLSGKPVRVDAMSTKFVH